MSASCTTTSVPPRQRPLARELVADLKAFARDEAIAVRTYRRAAQAYYDAVRDLILGSDMSRVENVESARRLRASLQETLTGTTGLMAALRRQRDRFNELHGRTGELDSAVEVARAAYDHVLAEFFRRQRRLASCAGQARVPNCGAYASISSSNLVARLGGGRSTKSKRG